MCLMKITETVIPPDPKERKAWKLVNASMETPFQSTKLSTEWIQAEEMFVRTEPWHLGRFSYDWCVGVTPYTSGFHTYPTREAARTAKRLLNDRGYKIVPVWVKEITYKGIDGTSDEKSFVAAAIPNLVSRWIRLA